MMIQKGILEPMKIEPLLSVEDVREMLKLKSVQTVYRWIKKGKITPTYLGRNVRFKYSDVINFIDKGCAGGNFNVGESPRPSLTSKKRKPIWEK